MKAILDIVYDLVIIVIPFFPLGLSLWLCKSTLTACSIGFIGFVATVGVYMLLSREED